MADYDVIVIGAGPGGYVAAIRCAQLGMKTALIEKRETLGGTCLNVGCIPSKALLESSYLYHHLKDQGKEHGIIADRSNFDFDVMMNRKEKVVDGLVTGVAGLVKKNQIESINGEASFLSPNEITVEDKTYTADAFIIATGSESISLPFLPFNETTVVSSTGALSLKKVPEELIVVGAGVIGVELASVYARLGSKVTLVEMLDQICSPLDRSTANAFMKILKKQGLTFHLSTKVTKGDSNGKLTIEKEGKTEELSADVILVSVGRKPFTEGLATEKAGVEVNERGMIQVDHQFKTIAANIYAIGDVIDGPMLAHKASEEGIAVAELLAGKQSHVNYIAIPNVIYTHPEVASVGLSEEEAAAHGIPIILGKFSFKANARARCAGDTEGEVKIIAKKEGGQIIGLHIVGAQASEMIGEGVVAIESRLTLEQLASASHAHPTLSESIKEAALNALGRTLHS